MNYQQRNKGLPFLSFGWFPGKSHLLHLSVYKFHIHTHISNSAFLLDWKVDLGENTNNSGSVRTLLRNLYQYLQRYWTDVYNTSVQFSCSVMSDSLRLHESQHTRPPCPSPTPGVYPNSYPSSQSCHQAISSSVVPFSCPQSLPASGSFPMSQLFTSGGQTIGVSASTSVLPMNTQDWSPLGWIGWILQSKGLSRIFSNTTVQKLQFFGAQLSSGSNSHIHTWPLDKP